MAHNMVFTNEMINYHVTMWSLIIPYVVFGKTIWKESNTDASETLVREPDSTLIGNKIARKMRINNEESQTYTEKNVRDERFKLGSQTRMLKENPTRTKEYYSDDEKFDKSDYNSDNYTITDGGKEQEENLKRAIRDTQNELKNVACLEYPYDYDEFHREYIDYIWEKRKESRMEPSTIPSRFGMNYLSWNPTCLPDDWKTGVGAIAVYCIIQRGSKQGFTKDEFSRLGHILKFWAIVYFAAGAVFWITCGWCCCCLKCKIFNPDEIRNEVCCYAINNPPGVMKNIDTGCTIEYTPTQEEIKAHQELKIKAFAFV